VQQSHLLAISSCFCIVTDHETWTEKSQKTCKLNMMQLIDGQLQVILQVEQSEKQPHRGFDHSVIFELLQMYRVGLLLLLGGG
jgi:hypothetical protein